MNRLWILLALALPAHADPLESVAFLVGEWDGEGKHPYGSYQETQKAERALGGTIIEVHTKSTMGSQTVHEDRRVLSFDPKTKQIRMRQWAKGILRVYAATVEKDRVVFRQIAKEGAAEDAWRYTFTRVDGGFDYQVHVDDKPFVQGRLRQETKDPGKPGALGIRQYEAKVAGMPAQIHHPDGEGPFPVIVFSPGGQANTFQGYRPYGRFWATWGYVTVIVAFKDAKAEERAPKFRKALDWVLQENAREGSPLKGMIDAKRLAVAGHSRGGNAALRAAKQDERVIACLALAPSGPAEPIEGKGKGACCIIIGDQDQFRTQAAKAHEHWKGEKYEFVIPGMTHMLAPREATLKLVQRATAFWHVALNGDARYKAFLKPS
ncbi:MAG: hypothetical protein AAGD14_09970 [Planctomycetota bacterium]